MKILTDFRKTVETGMDPRLIKHPVNIKFVQFNATEICQLTTLSCVF